jgi:hypothetical protein
MVLFDMNDPNSIPPISDVVANFEKILGNISESIPAPLS